MLVDIVHKLTSLGRREVDVVGGAVPPGNANGKPAVPAVKAGWPSTSALREFDRVTFAMLFAVTHLRAYKSWGRLFDQGGPAPFSPLQGNVRDRTLGPVRCRTNAGERARKHCYPLWKTSALLMDCAGRLLTCPHATSTGVSTDPAVLMVGSMTLTLLATEAASCGAHIQHPADNLLVRASAARGNYTSDVAYVGTVQIQTDTLRQVVNIVFSQTCICAGGTYLGARVAFLDAPNEGVIRISENIRMGCDHRQGLHWGSPVPRDGIFARKSIHLHSVPRLSARRPQLSSEGTTLMFSCDPKPGVKSKEIHSALGRRARAMRCPRLDGTAET
jgi:hypothetical protein